MESKPELGIFIKSPNIEIIECCGISELDFIVVPSTFSQAPRIKHKEINDTSLIWTAMGYPCMNIPFKYSKNSLPFGLLIISGEFNDFSLLEFCKKIKLKGMIKNIYE